MTRRAIITGTMPTRRAKPHAPRPERICAACANAKPTSTHFCFMVGCVCEVCKERAGR